MTELSTTVNPRQPDTLPSSTFQNLKSDRQCIVVTTRGGKQSIDPPMSSKVEFDTNRDDDMVERGESPRTR